MRRLWQKREKPVNLTQEEIPVLPRKYNLTDGHVHRKWHTSFQKTVQELSAIFESISREQLPELEDEFLRKFYALAGQSLDFNKTDYFLCTSASMALEIAANYARRHKLSLSLIEPCFDNLAGIFRRHNVPLKPLPDEAIAEGRLREHIEQDTSSAICIVSPNNPTGTTLSESDLEALVGHCEDKDTLLIIDSSFRFYNPKYNWDQYALLRDSKVDYIVIEDTGKTWPTHELKLGVLAVRNRLFDEFYDIYTDMLLHVSPFTVKLLTECVKNSQEQNFRDITEVIDENRNTLYKAVEGTILTPTENPFMSVYWLKIGVGYTAEEVQKHLAQAGVYVLPGTHFYWGNREKGNSYIRVALARDSVMFREAISVMKNALGNI